MAASCQLGSLLLRRDVQISSFAAAGAGVPFMWVCLKAAFLVKYSIKPRLFS